MRAHTVLSVLRRCLNHWMPALAVALLLVLGGGTSWAQTAVPTGPDTQPSPAYLPPPDDPDPPAQYDDAAVVSISAPATMTPGGTAYVTVTMRNSGTTTWYPALTTYPYRLGSQNPANNSTWGVGRVELGSTVAPGGQVVFGFTITAPTTAGTYSFSWGMLRENLAWFGAIASSTITVSAPAPVYDAQLVSASVPAQMGVGGNYNVSLTFKNTGNVTWTQADYRIGSSSPADNTTWGFARVDMGVASVAPGQSATFNFQVHAPATAGTYLFDWGMLYELHWRFGQTSGISVTVGGTNSSVTYIHTDGLGSPVARTDGAGNVINRTRYEPYGYVASGVQPTIGFTGHVNDVDTGLTYMQQRYYDPVAGRFLSIDPVIADANTGSSFNRYSYAMNSPYNFIDPDGREIKPIGTNAEVGAINRALRKIEDSNPSSKARVQSMRNSANVHTVRFPGAGEAPENKTTGIKANESNGVGTGSETIVNPNASITTVNKDGTSVISSGETVLAHELLGHGGDKDQGVIDRSINPKTGERKSEESAIHAENEYKDAVGELRRDCHSQC
jgi:RHS repeat-associated protein